MAATIHSSLGADNSEKLKTMGSHYIKKKKKKNAYDSLPQSVLVHEMFS